MYELNNFLFESEKNREEEEDYVICQKITFFFLVFYYYLVYKMPRAVYPGNMNSKGVYIY